MAFMTYRHHVDEGSFSFPLNRRSHILRDCENKN